MNLDEIQNAWNSPRNQLPPEQQQLAQGFIHQMIRRRRFQAIWLTNTFVWLTLMTLGFGVAIEAGKFNFAQEWAVLPLLIAPWLVALHFLRRYRKSASPVSDGTMSVGDSLRAARAALHTERSHLKLVAALLAGMIPFVALAVQQLHAAGKVSSNQQVCMAVLFGGALLAGMVGVAVRYFWRVTPQARQLNAVLTEMVA